MSVLNQSGEEQAECPLCMEPLEVDDLNFYPCTCGYQICRFCWNRIREGENGLCPACRKAYPENPADFTPLSQEQVAAIKTEKKAREQKRRVKTLESRQKLANVRVVQNNLVFVVGLPVRLADPEILKRQEYFGKYGKIHKVVINQSTTYAGSQGPSASAYVTYVSSADALRAIQGVNNVTLDGRVLKGSLGTTKYCANFMKNQPCPKPDCMYLHELGDEKASFTKEQMHQGLHQVYERKLHNQLLTASRDKPSEEKQSNSSSSSGASSTSGEKCSSKDGNQSNFIPTMEASSNINVVNTSKSRKDSVNGSSSNGIGKEAWPSLGSSPPAHSPPRKQPSPKPKDNTGKLENGTSESSSPTPQIQPQAQTKIKDNTDNSKNSRVKDSSNSTNGHTSKKSKKQKTNSINDADIDNAAEQSQTVTRSPSEQPSVFESESQMNYLTNELVELESDRHSLLENHDLLDSDHSLLEDDDNTHNLLNDVNNEVIMMQRHREMLSGINDNPLLQMKGQLVNGYGMVNRDLSYLGSDSSHSQMNQGILEQKEVLMRERGRSEMFMRQIELLRQPNAMVENKHYMPTTNLAMDSTNELIGANYHPNHNILPPFGMRVDNSMASNTLGVNTMSTSSLVNNLGTNSMVANSLPGNPHVANGISSNSMMANSILSNNIGNTMVDNSISAINMIGNPVGGNVLVGNTMGGGYLLHNQQLLQQNQSQIPQNAMVNGFEVPHNSTEGRYLAENMDKFFTDFHKAQQMRIMMNRSVEDEMSHRGYNLLHLEHKQRMNNHMVGNEQSMGGGGRASGDNDDDLDFDPFKETQKALAEMMESEKNTVPAGDSVNMARRTHLPPPGFSHVGGFGVPLGSQHPYQQQGYSTNNATYSDWTQMDPAIMSTSVNFNKSQQQQQQQHQQQQQQQQHQQQHQHQQQQQHLQHQHQSQTLSQQQQELFARFNSLGLQQNGLTKIQLPQNPQQWNQKLPSSWNASFANYGVTNIPLPPGFAPPKQSQRATEVIDAK